MFDKAINPNIISLLPAYFKTIKDFIALMETEDIELSRFEGYLLHVKDNFFIQTCDEATLKYHERLLNIIVSPSDTIEFRRLRVLNRYNNLGRITLVTLKERLNFLIGVGGYIVDIDYNSYHFSLTISSGKYGIMDELLNMLTYILPANLTFGITQNIHAAATMNIYTSVILNPAMIYTFK